MADFDDVFKILHMTQPILRTPPADEPLIIPPVEQGQPGQRLDAQQQELLQTAVNDYYQAMEDQGITPALGGDTTKFELDINGQLWLKAYPDLAIVNSKTMKPLSLNTIDSR